MPALDHRNASSSSAPALAAAGAFVAGSDAPERSEVKVGFMPLTDCASVIMASALGFDRQFGIKIIPVRETSWASVRDKLVVGALDCAHVLHSLVYDVHLGAHGPKRDMAVLMTLNNNGQGISLSRRLVDQGVTGLESLARLIERRQRTYIFAHTFPTGTHALWLYYWLASAGIDPFDDLSTLVVPPSHMLAQVRAGNVDGFSVGEPWNHRGIMDGNSVHAASSQDIWPDHPEKVLGATADFVDQYPNTARAVTAAVLQASRWIDASAANKLQMVVTLAQRRFIDTDAGAIRERILGSYQDGLGKTWHDPLHMKFHGDGAVNFPYLSDGMWFLTQLKRWGVLRTHPNYEQLAREVQRIDLYRQAAALAGVPANFASKRSSVLIDGKRWDGEDAAAYADSFAISYANRAPSMAA